jgi:hypothetical protein
MHAHHITNRCGYRSAPISMAAGTARTETFNPKKHNALRIPRVNGSNLPRAYAIQRSPRNLTVTKAYDLINASLHLPPEAHGQFLNLSES